MTQYINKAALMAEIERRLEALANTSAGDNREFAAIIGAQHYELINLAQYINTLEVKEVETHVIPKHSYFEHIYHCGSEPKWKIGDVLAAYEFYSDHEGEYVYGKITDVKMDENEDWRYTFDNGNVLYENMLISDEAYKM